MRLAERLVPMIAAPLPYRFHRPARPLPFTPHDDIVSNAAQKAMAFHPRSDRLLEPCIQDLMQDDIRQEW